jgi:hypothetical protein
MSTSQLICRRNAAVKRPDIEPPMITARRSRWCPLRLIEVERAALHTFRVVL